MRIIYLLIFISIATLGKIEAQTIDLQFGLHPPYDLWKHQLDNIDYKDGVDYAEAEIIIKNFALSEKAAGCGDIGIVVDYGAFWKAGTRVGFAATKGESILIHKKKAYISQGAKKLYDHPKDMVLIYPKTLKEISKK